MAKRSELLALLQDLRSHYQYYKPDDASAVVEQFTRQLSDVPAWVLQSAIDDVKATSKWFPSVADIRTKACEVANVNSYGGGSFDSVPEEPVDFLMAEFQQLKHDFCYHRKYDKAEWQRVSSAFRRSGRLDMAAHVQKAAENYEYVLENEYTPDYIEQYYQS